jgi:hypothetical protein
MWTKGRHREPSNLEQSKRCTNAEIRRQSPADEACAVSLDDICGGSADRDGGAALENREQRVCDAADQQCAGSGSTTGCACPARALDTGSFRNSSPWRRIGAGRLLPAKSGCGPEGLRGGRRGSLSKKRRGRTAITRMKSAEAIKLITDEGSRECARLRL